MRDRIQEVVPRLLITPLVAMALFVNTIQAAPTPETLRQNQADFDLMWSEIGSSYAYFDKRATDWEKVKTLYRPQLSQVETRDDFIGVLEDVLAELYDSHAHLDTNTKKSPKLIPSGTDLWAEWDGNRAVLTEVRSGSVAARAGLKAGTEVFSIDGEGIREAVDRRLPRCLRAPDPAAKDWALRVALAGRRGESRRIVAQTGRTRGEFRLEDSTQALPGSDGRLHHHRLKLDEKDVGYVRIHNSLGSVELLPDFDAALKELEATSGLVLDLRDTPSGGNTTVARGIMGRFLEREGFYQEHSLPEEERAFGVKRSWEEIVSPRGDRPYRGPVVVLVDHWTGSMGEGIAIGMDGLKRATVVGTKMAGLLGATRTIQLPNSGIGVNVPAEKLFHVNGTPREDFVPAVLVDLRKAEHQTAQDPILDAGLETLRTKLRSDRSK